MANIKNIVLGATVSAVTVLAAVGVMKHISNTNESQDNARNADDDFYELKVINGDIYNAESLDEVVDAMHRANEIFARHNTDEKFRELHAKVLEYGVERSCEFLDECKKEKEA